MEMAAHQHVGLIGYGAIGRDLHARLALDPQYRFTILLREAADAVAGRETTTVRTLDELIAARPDLVVEAAGQAVVAELVPALLEAGIDVVAVSSGALGDGELLGRLTRIAQNSGARLTVPPGAIGGLDYLAALHGVEGVRVRYTSRKPVAAWADELREIGQDPERLRGEIALFEGSPAEAARRYPRNLNASLTVALAAGAERTIVRVVADPAVVRNTHEIAVESPVGEAFMSFANLPSPANPKTSALTALSLAAVVRRHFDPVII
jgi:aspartate dehydrogenase